MIGVAAHMATATARRAFRTLGRGERLGTRAHLHSVAAAPTVNRYCSGVLTAMGCRRDSGRYSGDPLSTRIGLTGPIEARAGQPPLSRGGRRRTRS
jgi:hypothetical protein